MKPIAATESEMEITFSLSITKYKKMEKGFATNIVKTLHLLTKP